MGCLKLLPGDREERKRTESDRDSTRDRERQRQAEAERELLTSRSSAAGTVSQAGSSIRLRRCD